MSENSKKVIESLLDDSSENGLNNENVLSLFAKIFLSEDYISDLTDDVNIKHMLFVHGVSSSANVIEAELLSSKTVALMI